MTNLKRRYIEVALVVVILLTLTSGRVFGEEVRPLRDFMFQPPNSIYAKYGYSEDTFRFYNFIHLKDICQIFEAQIKALRAEIDELKEQVAELKKPVKVLPLVSDPNDVGEGKE